MRTWYPYNVKVDDKGNVVKQGFLHDVADSIPQLAVEKVASKPSIRGIVWSTRPEDGLVALSVGTADGIKQQQTVDIVRDGKRIELRVATDNMQYRK